MLRDRILGKFTEEGDELETIFFDQIVEIKYVPQGNGRMVITYEDGEKEEFGGILGDADYPGCLGITTALYQKFVLTKIDFTGGGIAAYQLLMNFDPPITLEFDLNSRKATIT